MGDMVNDELDERAWKKDYPIWRKGFSYGCGLGLLIGYFLGASVTIIVWQMTS